MLTVSAVAAPFDAAFAPPARAADDDAASPYERRQRDLERRRELMRAA